jgi:transcriptional regulator with XRE-family HTH domain
MKRIGLLGARLRLGLTQLQAAGQLGVSQAYLAMLESGARPLTLQVARRALRAYALPASSLPVPRRLDTRADLGRLAEDLGALGCPGLPRPAPESWEARHPAEVLLVALAQDDLVPPLIAALPWLLAEHPGLDQDWLVHEAKLRDLQNRLGFVAGLARALLEARWERPAAATLGGLEARIEPSRLAREDTLCQAAMPEPERVRLRAERCETARHWNLLTDLRPAT